MKKILSLIIILFLVLYGSPAFATNGTNLIGIGSSSKIMGGTGAVEPQDSAGLFQNPAGVTKTGHRFDVELETAIIDHKIDSSPAPVGAFANAAGIQKSKANVFFAPTLAYSDRYKDSNYYYGVGLALTSGLKAHFKNSRLGVAANAFDTRIESATIEFVPTLAYKPNDQLSLGISPVFTMKSLISNLTTLGLTETAGDENYKYAWGGGFNIGAIYDVNDKLSLGLAHQSMRWMSKFDDYGDIGGRLDSAPTYTVGAAYKPNDQWLLEMNIKWIQWTAVKSISRLPGQGGYGWKNQWVFGLGTQYKASNKLKLRAGYNYARSPIRPDVLYGNALTPLISEHHMGIGFSYDVTEKFNVDVGWLHTFKNSMRDDGGGDAISTSGRGTKAWLTVSSIIVAAGYKFG